MLSNVLACALYGAGALDLVPIRKIKTCFNGLSLALGLTYISQFLNDMTIRALVVSFIPAAWFTLTYRLKKPKDGVVLSFIKLVLEIILTIAIAGGIQYVIKMLIKGMTKIILLEFWLKRGQRIIFGFQKSNDRPTR